MENPAAYIPLDRRRALGQGVDLPTYTTGAALFADISGFTPLTEALTRAYGPRLGADELTRHLNQVYQALIAEVHRYGGSVIGFSGDAITCWFDESLAPVPAVFPACAAALAMQRAMRVFADLALPDEQVHLALKTAVAAGGVHRFVVGDPAIRRIDVLAGELLERMSRAEQAARQGELVVDARTAQLADGLEGDWFRCGGESFLRVRSLAVAPPPVTQDLEPALPAEIVREWLSPQVYARMHSEQGRFLAELRPASALFLKFDGLHVEDDPDAGQRLDAYIRWVQHVIDRYDGVLIQLTTGDKGSYLYAAFGAPIAHDDDPERAVTAALDLLRSPEEFPWITGVHLGVSHGRMRVGAYGSETRRTYGVLGDEVNLAARLMSAAATGQILVSPRVAEAVRLRFRLRPLGPMTFKGKEQPLLVYAVEGRSQVTGEQLPVLFHTPVVGRRSELARMAALLDEVTAGRGRLLRISGEAGVGKTRLAAAFLDEAVSRGVQLAVGACQSTSRDTAYGAARQIARQLLGLPGQVGSLRPEEEVAHVEATLGALHPEWLVRLPLLGDLLGLPIPDNPTTAALDPELRQEALIALAVEIVLFRAWQRPLVLFVEDIHWIDEASLRLLLALARVLDQAPVLLVVSHRPAAEDFMPRMAEFFGLAGQVHMALEELPPDAVADLVQARLGEKVDPLVLALIQQQAQGNPFFTEELVDALREEHMLVRAEGVWRLSDALLAQLQADGCLERVDGTWRLAPDASLSAVRLGLPDSVHGIVLARLDRLPEEHKLTLKVASVIGRVFEFDLLAAAHPAAPDENRLFAQVETLSRRDFARLERPYPRVSYIFKHSITQEVVYRTLLTSQQQELHGAIAQELERLQPDAVERLAFHYRHADLSAPPLREKALRYLVAAGEKARREYANETALAYFDRALALENHWPWLAAKVELLHILGRREEERAALETLSQEADAPSFQVNFLWADYYEAVSDYPAAQAAAEQALAAAQAAGDRRAEARALLALAEIARRQGRFADEETRYRQTLALLGNETAYQAERAEVLYGLGILHRQQGRYADAEAELEEALALHRALNDRQAEARTLTALASIVLLHRRDYSAARHYNQQALELRRTIGDRTGEGASLLSLAQSARALGDYGEARRLLREALAIQRATNNRWREAIVLNELGIVYLLVGRLAEAESHLREALALSEAIGAEAGRPYVLVNLGQVLRDAGRIQEAQSVLEEGLAIAQRQGDRYLQAQYLSDLALTHLAAEEWPQAVERATDALTLLRDLDLAVSTTTELTTLALAYWALGEEQDALYCVDDALEILDACQGDGPDFPHRDYFVCARVLAAAGQVERSRQALAAAHRLLQAQAARISDEAMRRSYLEDVRVNREIALGAREVG